MDAWVRARVDLGARICTRVDASSLNLFNLLLMGRMGRSMGLIYIHKQYQSSTEEFNGQINTT